MTLILSYVTPYGVAMAADDAISEVWGSHGRVLRGATKLFAHYGAHAGIGIWGEGVLPFPAFGVPASGFPLVPLEFVIKEFLRQSTTVRRIDELANLLGGYLNDTYAKAKRAVAIDVAGCLDEEGKFLPVIFRLANCNDPFADEPGIGHFTTQTIRVPKPFEDRDQFPIVGGNVNAGYWVNELTFALTEAGKRTFADVPGSSLESRQRFLGVMARSVSDIYTNMTQIRSIGAVVATLGVDNQSGSVSFSS